MSDLIRRQDAIDAVTGAIWHYPNECYKNLNVYEVAEALVSDAIKALPSARPNGEWIVEHDGNGWNDWENFICPVCGEKFEKVVNRRKYKFCSHCGAEMEVEHE